MADVKHGRAQDGISAALELQSGVLAGTETHVVVPPDVPTPLPKLGVTLALDPVDLDPSDPLDSDVPPPEEDPDEQIVPPVTGLFAQLQTASVALSTAAISEAGQEVATQGETSEVKVALFAAVHWHA